VSFAAPLWLGIAALVGAGVLVAHLFQRTVPPQDVLPTVRFVPAGTPMAVRRSRRLSDVLLLLLRLAIVALLGVALAAPYASTGAPARVVLADRSRAVASISEVADSVRAAGGNTLIAFDSTPTALRDDSPGALSRSTARGSLSAALVAAHRAIAHATEGREAVELVIVSPLVQEELDSATMTLLAMWPGPTRLVRVRAVAPRAPAWEIRASGDDPAVAALGPSPRGPVTLRVVRGAPTQADSQWARAGGTLVVWPADGSGPVRRSQQDTAAAVAAGDAVVVASFVRTHDPGPGTPLAHWGDGRPAASEQAIGLGCVRHVAVPVDAVGDVSLRASFGRLTRAFVAPCGGARDFRAAELPRRHAAPAAGVPRPASTSLPLLLAVIATLLLAAEQVVRRPRSAA